MLSIIWLGILLFMLLVCFIALVFLDYGVHLDIYRESDEPKGGYISTKDLFNYFRKYSPEMFALSRFKGSLWSFESPEEKAQKIRDIPPNLPRQEIRKRIEGLLDGEDFEWHASRIMIEGKRFWTNPYAYYFAKALAEKAWKELEKSEHPWSNYNDKVAKSYKELIRS